MQRFFFRGTTYGDTRNSELKAGGFHNFEHIFHRQRIEHRSQVMVSIFPFTKNVEAQVNFTIGKS